MGSVQGGKHRGWGKRNPLFAPLAFLPRTLISSGLLDSAPEGPNESSGLGGKAMFAKGGILT